jgi:hypothetical protein
MEKRGRRRRLGSAAEQSLAGVKKFLRVDRFALDADFIVQMRSG